MCMKLSVQNCFCELITSMTYVHILINNLPNVNVTVKDITLTFAKIKVN